MRKAYYEVTMLINILIKVPEGLDITDPVWQSQNMQVVWELSQILHVYTPDKTPGTDYQNPYKLVHASIQSVVEDPLAYIEGLFAIYELDWTVLAMQSFYNTSEDEWDYTDPENPVLVSPAAPTIFRPVDTVAVLPFLQTRYIYEGDPPEVVGEQTKDISWLHKYAGMADWR